MKSKHVLFALFCLGASCATVLTLNAVQDTQPASTGDPCEMLRADLRKQQESPDAVTVGVLFFDINHDGIPEALIAPVPIIRSGGGGYDWVFHRFENGAWQMIPNKYVLTDEDTADQSYHVFADDDEFYSLTRDGQKPKLVFISSARCKEDDGVMVRDFAYEITIDSDGYLKTIPIPELTVTYLAPWGDGDSVVIPDLGPEYEALYKLLVPHPSEWFYGRERSKEEIAQIMAKADAEIQADIEKIASLSADRQVTPSREEKSEIRDEESGTDAELPKAPNHRWLYVGIALFALCAIFYFLRKK